MALHRKILIKSIRPKRTPNATQSQVSQVGLATPPPTAHKPEEPADPGSATYTEVEMVRVSAA